MTIFRSLFKTLNAILVGERLYTDIEFIEMASLSTGSSPVRLQGLQTDNGFSSDSQPLDLSLPTKSSPPNEDSMKLTPAPQPEHPSCSDADLVLSFHSYAKINSTVEVSSSPMELSTSSSQPNVQIKTAPSLHSSLEAPTTSTATWSEDTQSWIFTKVPEEAQQVAPIKMMGQQKKQAMTEAAKEAKTQRQKNREQLKIFRQQEKMKRLQQLRMNKELRAQQILQEKRQKKEEAAIAKRMEAEKRNKEKEQQRLEAVILKQQEKERVKQQMMLMKAAEAQRKAEEKERVKQQMMLEKEKKAEEKERIQQQMMLMKAAEDKKKAQEKELLKRLKERVKKVNKARELELKRLEREKAKELEKPREDLCLADHQPLPELSRIPGLVLSERTCSDCLTVLEFLHRFGKALDLGLENSKPLTMTDLQEGLLNIGESMSVVQDMLVNMLSAAWRDPGMPAAHKSKTILGEQVTDVEIARDNVSEMLQLYMEAHAEQKEAANSLMTKPFRAHTPSEKASMLVFLTNELCGSKVVISEINKNINCLINLRKDERAVQGKIHKLRSINAKKTEEKACGVVAEDSDTITNKCKRTDEDSDDGYIQGDGLTEESAAKKARIRVEEVGVFSRKEVEMELEKEYNQGSQIRKKMLDSSRSLRSPMIGRDRYKRRYWVLSHSPGVFVERFEGDEDSEELEEGKQTKAAAETLPISGTSPSPVLDHGSQHAEGVNESKTPVPPTCASCPDVHTVETGDYSTPQPVPEEMLRGWWTVSENEDLQSLAQALHSRGVREKVLQKQIQKHMEDVDLLSTDTEAGFQETTEDWHVEERQMETIPVALCGLSHKKVTE